MNPYSQNTLKGWFFDVGYLYIIVAALVTLGFAFKSLDLRTPSVTVAEESKYAADLVESP